MACLPGLLIHVLIINLLALCVSSEHLLRILVSTDNHLVRHSAVCLVAVRYAYSSLPCT